MKTYYQLLLERTQQQTEEEFFESRLRSVAPGDEVGRKRAAKTAKRMAADFHRLFEDPPHRES